MSRVVNSSRLVVTCGRPRDARRDAGNRGSFENPKRVLGPNSAEKSTVYTIRLTTGKRGTLTDPMAGVSLCLVGPDGDTFIHHIPPVTDLEEMNKQILAICQSEDTPPPEGADCRTALSSVAVDFSESSASEDGEQHSTLSRRFLSGAVDEICFLGPNLSPLQGLIVGPDAGQWLCEEINVASSASGETARFVCRDSLGERGSHSAVYLKPIPEGGIVYGTGDTATVLTKQEAAEYQRKSNEWYDTVKQRVLAGTAILTGLGTVATHFTLGPDLAVPFAIGGTSSLAYQMFLQARVDEIAATANESERNGKQVQLIGAALAWVGMTAYLVSRLHHDGASDGDSGIQVAQLAAGLGGFLCQRFALIVVYYLAAADEPGPGLANGMASKKSSSMDGSRSKNRQE